MASQSPLEQIRPTYTGGSTGSQFSSRNPYRDSVDDRVSRSGHTTPLESPRPFAPHGTKGQQALEGHQTSGTTNGESSSDIYSSTPPLPPRPENFLPERPRLPPREGAEVVDSPHPGFTAPYFPHCPEQEETDRDGLPSASDEDMLPPRRRLTTGDVAVTSVIYARNAERLIAYLIPLPAPTRQGQVLDVPQVRQQAFPLDEGKGYQLYGPLTQLPPHHSVTCSTHPQRRISSSRKAKSTSATKSSASRSKR